MVFVIHMIFKRHLSLCKIVLVFLPLGGCLGNVVGDAPPTQATASSGSNEKSNNLENCEYNGEFKEGSSWKSMGLKSKSRHGRGKTNLYCEGEFVWDGIYHEDKFIRGTVTKNKDGKHAIFVIKSGSFDYAANEWLYEGIVFDSKGTLFGQGILRENSCWNRRPDCIEEKKSFVPPGTPLDKGKTFLQEYITSPFKVMTPIQTQTTTGKSATSNLNKNIQNLTQPMGTTSQNASPETTASFLTLNKAKVQCTEIGLTEKTREFAKCVMRLMR